MALASDRQLVGVLLDRHGRLYGEEAGIDVASPTIDDLFRLLALSILLREPSDPKAAVRAVRRFHERGWPSAYELMRAGRDAVADVLREAGHERTEDAQVLVDVATEVHERYQGDLQRIRDEADERPDEERRLLGSLPGVSDAVLDLFFREVQAAWEEVAPFADRSTLKAAGLLGLGEDARALGRQVEADDLPRLVTALYRVEREQIYDTVVHEAENAKKHGYEKYQEGTRRI